MSELQGEIDVLMLGSLLGQPDGWGTITYDFNTVTMDVSNLTATMNGVPMLVLPGTAHWILDGTHLAFEDGNIGWGTTLDHPFTGDLESVLLTQLPHGNSIASANIGAFYGWEGETSFGLMQTPPGADSIEAAAVYSVPEPGVWGLIVLASFALILSRIKLR